MKSAPARPANLIAVWTTEGRIQASCDRVLLATAYRWRVRVIGVDADFRRATSTRDPPATIALADAGLGVELYVQAANRNSQGVASQIVTLFPEALKSAAAATTEARAKAETRTAIVQAAPVVVEEKAEPLLPTELLSRNGSQNGNGLDLARA